MSEETNNVTLIPSKEEVADDIVSDPAQDGQATLVSTDNDKTNTNGHTDDTTEIKEEEDSDYDPPKFDEICEFLENEEGLDIYQLVAFRVKSGAGCLATRRKYEFQFDRGDEDDGEKDNKDDEDCNISCFGYYMDIIKAIICFFTQFASIFVLYFYTSDMKEESGKTWCDQTTDLSSKIMAISYAFFLSLIFHLNFQNQKCGFYKNIDYHMYNHNFISSNWLRIGQLINGILALNVFYLSFLVIFFSTDPLDIILNCVALFFLLDIDNMVIDSTDYKKTLQWFKNADNTNKYEKKDANACQVCIYYLFMIIYYLLIGLTYIGIVVVPFMVAVCY